MRSSLFLVLALLMGVSTGCRTCRYTCCCSDTQAGYGMHEPAAPVPPAPAAEKSVSIGERIPLSDLLPPKPRAEELN